MVGFHDSSASTLAYPACIIEGVTWRDVANHSATPSPIMASARRLCRQIAQRHQEQESKRLDRELETNPIKLVPIEEVQQRAGGK